jgi:clan AA aspartic protease (TIGR02281 family)
MQKEGGVYWIPCKVNGLKMNFVFDTGASSVVMSLSEAAFMIKNGYLSAKDVMGSTKAQVADGRITENTKVMLREIEIGGLKLYNVEAIIVHNIDAPLLLGQSVISRLGKIQLDGDVLIVTSKTSNTTPRTNNINTTKKTTAYKQQPTTTKKTTAYKQQSALYYDENWKGLPSASGASYYRIAYIASNSNYKSYFIDYYITGEIQSEGSFTRIDLHDDANSLYHGEVLWYYKSGKLAGKTKFVNGKREGESFLYEEDGSYSRLWYNNDIPESLYWFIDRNGRETLKGLNNTTNQTTNSSNTYSVDVKKISVNYFEKEGLSSKETFSIKNETGRDVKSLTVRFIYELENGEIIDSRDINVIGPIPNGLSKKFTVESFDKNYQFVFKYGNGYKGNCTLFTISYQILGYN